MIKNRVKNVQPASPRSLFFHFEWKGELPHFLRVSFILPKNYKIIVNSFAVISSHSLNSLE